MSGVFCLRGRLFDNNIFIFLLKFGCFGRYVLKCWLARSLSVFIVIFMKGFRMTNLQVRGMSAAHAASVVMMLSAIIGTTWHLSNSLGEIRVELSELRGDVRVLDTRMSGMEDRFGGLENRVGRLEVTVQGLQVDVQGLKVSVTNLEEEARDTNKYLRKSENQDVHKDTSASDITPDSP